MRFLLASILAFAVLLPAEAVEIEGIVSAVDATNGKLFIKRKTASGDKALSLDVSPQVGNLALLKTGDKVALTYDPEQEVVTKINGGTWGSPGTSQPKPGEPINMIAQDSLKGWHFDKPGQEPNWAVVNGVLICTGEGPNLVSDQTFDDFEMKLEFLLPPKCNSGIYLRNRYEIQFLDSMWRSPNNQPAPQHQITGAVWGYVSPTKDAYLGPNRWNRLSARLVGDRITVELNDKKLIANQRVNRRLGSNQDEAVAALGPFLLQYLTDTIGMKIRNFVVTPIAPKN